MDAPTILFAVNATLLILHELESAYWREWELFRLKGGITVFALLHLPLVLLLFWGFLAARDRSTTGYVLSLVTGAGGLLPLVVHRLLLPVKDRFNLPFSVALLILNAATGAGLIILTLLRW